jgi:DNA polymerase III sliding clamp (beta) subunit (PCNA family)
MQATVDANELRKALRTLKTFVGRSKNVKATELAAITTNADGGSVTVRRWNFTDATAGMDATAMPIEGGTVHVDAEALTTAIGNGKGAVTMTTEGERLTVSSATGTASVRIEGDADALPVPYSDGYSDFATILPSEREHVRSVAGAAANGRDARAVLTSVAITANGNGTGEASATDTYRLHVTRLERVSGSADVTRILPADVIATATKASTNFVQVEVSEDGAYFRVKFLTEGGTKRARRTTFFTVAGRTIEGPYPNYRSLVPDAADANARWSISDAAGTADVIAAFRNKEHSPAILAPAGSAVAVSMTYRDGAKRDAIAPMATDSDTIGLDAFVAFNPTYFAEGVQHSGDGATVHLRDASKAAVIEGEHGYALVMPMRVS